MESELPEQLAYNPRHWRNLFPVAKANTSKCNTRAYIYNITDPRDGLPFYVGVTNCPPRRCAVYNSIFNYPENHLTSTNSQRKVARRFIEIRQASLLPIFTIIYEVDEYKDGRYYEQRMIDHYRFINPSLVNRIGKGKGSRGQYQASSVFAGKDSIGAESGRIQG
jgi:hypothetical protein